MDGLKHNLDKAMKDYRCSPAFERTRSCFVKHFYEEGAARCRTFEEMTLDELLSIGSHDLCTMPAVGRRKIEALIQIFESLTRNYAEGLVGVTRTDFKAVNRKDREGQEHGGSLIDDFLAAIEQNTEDTDLILQGIRAALRKDSLEFAQSPILTELDLLLKTLRNSGLAESAHRCCLKEFWPEGHVRSSVLEELTVAELLQESAITLLTRKGVGLRKLQSLCLALTRLIDQSAGIGAKQRSGRQIRHSPHSSLSESAIAETLGRYEELSRQIRIPGLRIFAVELRRVLKEAELRELMLNATQSASSSEELFLRSQALVRGVNRKHRFDFVERWELLLLELKADENQLLIDLEPDTGYSDFERLLAIICIRVLMASTPKTAPAGLQSLQVSAEA